MKVTFDRYRVLHLIILIACSSILAETLISKLALARLSAYGFACTIITRLSNGVRSILEKSDSDRQAQNSMRRLREEKMEKRRDRRKR
jgi:DNA integrity scanning protein DisA with diadenylate cyclase activity